MPDYASPLRYPGGKSSLSPLLADVISKNKLHDGAYAEPFAGGAGAALNLLFAEYVQDLYLNDLDLCVYSFWDSILKDTTRFIDLIENTPITIDEWYKNKNIVDNPSKFSRLKLGFAAFFLNRTNRSGILKKAGPIGGYHQSGEWKLDVRFNKPDLIERIQIIADYSDRINFSNLDAIDFLSGIVLPIAKKQKIIVYLDPPYYEKGKDLYLNHYAHADHQVLSHLLLNSQHFSWILSYDNTDPIKSLYKEVDIIPFSLKYSAQNKRQGSELLIFNSKLLNVDSSILNPF